LLHGHRDNVEVFARTGTIDAQASVGLIGSPMGETDQVAFVAGEELVFNPIEWDRDVATAIDIGVESPLEVDYKAIDLFVAAGQLEFAGSAGGYVARMRDHKPPQSAMMIWHMSLPTPPYVSEPHRKFENNIGYSRKRCKEVCS
jgi:hypothetical protein